MSVSSWIHLLLEFAIGKPEPDEASVSVGRERLGGVDAAVVAAYRHRRVQPLFDTSHPGPGTERMDGRIGAEGGVGTRPPT